MQSIAKNPKVPPIGKSFIRPLLIALACYACAIVLGIGVYMLIARGAADGTNVPVERKPASGVSPTSTSTPQPSISAGEQKPISAAPVTVERLTLGASLDSNQRIAAATTTFSPEQTIYASVLTTGVAPAATLSAKWVYRETADLVSTWCRRQSEPR
ncbi:hypothetical protein [Dokdonella sp.]|uniref:hypothetical protein n=1 Tax=Dokdonella sp. TaxID=2291710 RepID=UPI0025BB1BC5|nr:hypothetical protein [Dokdonella sp.]MBX3689160.1 hypothetical protein [Dokdonella sp.]